MSLKRPRGIRSATTGDGEVATQPAPETPDSRWQARSPARQLRSPGQAGQSIFVITPVDETVGKGQLDLEFMRSCFYCNDSICSDIYMYSIMRAFCSPECRQKQMELEGIKVNQVKRARNPSGSGSGSGSGSVRGKPTAP